RPESIHHVSAIATCMTRTRLRPFGPCTGHGPPPLQVSPGITRLWHARWSLYLTKNRSRLLIPSRSDSRITLLH
ncbi:hypothetical protein COCCADRAFT_97615, partial [Bipolaris zeicola 26-R-13]